ncbi:hypothetical protein Tco_1557976 [Tanacetum coccineum]
MAASAHPNAPLLAAMQPTKRPFRADVTQKQTPFWVVKSQQANTPLGLLSTEPNAPLWQFYTAKRTLGGCFTQPNAPLLAAMQPTKRPFRADFTQKQTPLCGGGDDEDKDDGEVVVEMVMLVVAWWCWLRWDNSRRGGGGKNASEGE